MAFQDFLNQMRGGQSSGMPTLKFFSDEEEEERNKWQQRRQENFDKVIPSLTKLGRNLLEPIGRTVAQGGSNVLGGIMNEFRTGDKSQGGFEKFARGFAKGTIDNTGTDKNFFQPKHDVLSELGPSLGTRENSLPALALGMAGEIALPGPGGDVKAAKKLTSKLKTIFDRIDDYQGRQALMSLAGDNTTQIGQKLGPQGTPMGAGDIDAFVERGQKSFNWWDYTSRGAFNKEEKTTGLYSNTNLDNYIPITRYEADQLKGLALNVNGRNTVGVIQDSPLHPTKRTGVEGFLLHKTAPIADEFDIFTGKTTGNKMATPEQESLLEQLRKQATSRQFATKDRLPQGIAEHQQLTNRDRLTSLYEEVTAAAATDPSRVPNAAQRAYRDVTEDPKDPLEKSAYDWVSNNLDEAKKLYTARVNEEFGTTAGNVISSDEAKYIIPGFDSTRSAAYHEPASGIAKLMNKELLANDQTRELPVLIMSGGSGAGKTSALKVMGQNPSDFALVHDTNLNTLGVAERKISEALASGRVVRIQHVYRDPVEAFKNGVIPRVRSKGRIVPVDSHISTHFGSNEVFRKLVKKYGKNKNVEFNVIDNSNGKNKTRIIGVEELPELGYTKKELRTELYGQLNIAKQQGILDEAEVETFLTRTSRDTPNRSRDRAVDGGGLKSLDQPGQTTINGVDPVAAAKTQGFFDPADAAADVVQDAPRTGNKLGGPAKRMKFKRGDEFGTGVRLPITVKKTIPLPDEIRQIFQARQALDEFGTTEQTVILDLLTFDAFRGGQDIWIDKSQRAGAGMLEHGGRMPSSYPKWLPGHLHQKDLVENVTANWPNIPPAKNIRQRDLYEVIQNEINKRLGIGGSFSLDGVPDKAGESIVKMVGRTTRPAGTDVTFKGHTKTYRRRLIDEEIWFNREENTPPILPEVPIGDRVSVLQQVVDDKSVRDVGNITKKLAPMTRVMKQVFGKHYEGVKKAFIDPFDDAKGEYVNFVKNWQTRLRDEVVDKFNIQKSSKESAAVMDYGEGVKSYEDIVKDLGADRANDIIEAANWFRGTYDEFIDQINVVRAKVYPGRAEKQVKKRKDYFRHFQELTGLEGLKNLFETPAGIDPSLSGISAMTKPHSKWASFMQERLGMDSKRDAVGGFLEYIPAASHSIHIDPHIKKFRQLRLAMVNVTSNKGLPETYGKLNNFIEYLDEFANQLAGKTGHWDRALMETFPGGRKGIQLINWTNNRAKANMILGNVGSVISQIFNVPQGIANAGLRHSTMATLDMLRSTFGKGSPIEKSRFIAERYIGRGERSFDQRLIDQPKKMAIWTMELLDEAGTKYIWHAHYRKALKNKIDDPVRFADNATRDMVAGRGVGEVPLLQTEKSFQLIAPFQLEVANSWWVMKDWVDNKQFGKLMMFFAASYMFNEGVKSVRGSRVSFDPINALAEAVNEEDLTPLERGGRLVGEVASNLPVGQTLAQVFVPRPETRKKFFGRQDPTRFGTGLIASPTSLSDIPAKFALPFGGKQVERTIKGGIALARGESVSKTGLHRFPVDEIKPMIFGEFSTKTAQVYLDLGLKPLSEKQSEELRRRIREENANPQMTFYVAHRQRIQDAVEKQRKELEKDEDMTPELKIEVLTKHVEESQRSLARLAEVLRLSENDRKALSDVKLEAPKEKKGKRQKTLKKPRLRLQNNEDENLF